MFNLLGSFVKKRNACKSERLNFVIAIKTEKYVSSVFLLPRSFYFSFSSFVSIKIELQHLYNVLQES